MKLVTAKQIQEIDSIAINKFNIPSLLLMENAGGKVAKVVLSEIKSGEKVLVIAGRGNNGGDGLVVARHLLQAGVSTELALLSPPESLSADSQANFSELKKIKADFIALYEDSSYEDFARALHESKYLVDAIFGTGLNAEVAGRYSKIIEKINSSAKTVISIDIPSGLSADTGEPLGIAVRSKITVTFGLPKIGQFLPPAPEYIRDLRVVDIGFPNELLESYKTGYNLITPDLFNEYFGPRKSDSHKGDYGHVLVIAGSTGKMGAGYLASRAALRSGAGLVTFALPEAAFKKFDTRHAEVMIEPVKDDNKGHFVPESLEDLKKALLKKNAVALGPGIGTDKKTEEFVTSLVLKLNLPLVIDADALNNLAAHQKAFERRIRETVITPHPGEMARLTGLESKAVLKDRINITKNFSTSHKIYTVLKGNRTIVATPDGEIFINPTGNPGMSTAGTGDALTGMIASFIGQNIPVKTAVIAGVYIHGLAGDLASSKLGEVGMIASDLIENIPDAIKIVRQWKPSERVV